MDKSHLQDIEYYDCANENVITEKFSGPSFYFTRSLRQLAAPATRGGGGGASIL